MTSCLQARLGLYTEESLCCSTATSASRGLPQLPRRRVRLPSRQHGLLQPWCWTCRSRRRLPQQKRPAFLQPPSHDSALCGLAGVSTPYPEFLARLNTCGSSCLLYLAILAIRFFTDWPLGICGPFAAHQASSHPYSCSIVHADCAVMFNI